MTDLDACPICGGTDDHDRACHRAYEQEGGRLALDNARLRRELTEARQAAERWRQVALDHGRLMPLDPEPNPFPLQGRVE